MIKHCCLSLFLYLLLNSFLHAQPEVFENEQGLQGLRDKKTGNIILEPQYDQIKEFHEGIAAVELNWGWRYIDSIGKQLVPPIYTQANDFKHGRGLLRKDTINYWVTPQGRLITLGSGIINTSNDPVYYELSKNSKYGIIDSSGVEVLPIEYDIIYTIKGHSYFMTYKIVDNKAKYGFANLSDKIVVPAIYDNVMADRNLIKLYKDGKCGYMDSTGKIVLPLIYKAALYYGDSIFGVNDKDGYRLVINTGEEVSLRRYGYMSPYSKDKIIASNKRNKWGLIDSKGNKIIPFRYSSITSEKNLLKVRKGKKTGYINSKNKICIPVIYNSVIIKSHGYIIVSRHHKYGVVDTAGKIVIPLKYDTVSQIGLNFFMVSEDRKYGLYKDGNELLPVSYKKIQPLWIGYFIADSTLIDDKGNKIVARAYQIKKLAREVNDSSVLFSYRISFESSKTRGNLGVITGEGKQIAAAEYTDILFARDGVFWLEKEKRWAMFDYNGKNLTGFKYDDVSYLGKGIFKVLLNKQWGLVEAKSGEILPCQYQSMELSNNKYPAYIIAKKESKVGVLDLKGNIVIPFNYEDIKYQDSCFKSAQWQTIDCKTIEK